MIDRLASPDATRAEFLAALTDSSLLVRMNAVDRLAERAFGRDEAFVEPLVALVHGETADIVVMGPVRQKDYVRMRVEERSDRYPPGLVAALSRKT